MNIYRRLVIVAVCSLLLVGAYVATGPTYAQGGLEMSEWDEALGAVDDGIVEGRNFPPNPNPNPIITTDLIPGFRLDRSIHDQPWRQVDESWVKDPAPGLTEPTFISLTLYMLGDREEGVSAAKKRFGATIDDEFKTDDCPRLGSYSGQPVGDLCWAYTRGMAPSPRGSVNQVSTMVVIRGNDLFTLSVSCVDGGVPDSLTETLAQAVVERLNTWPRPSSVALTLEAEVLSKHVKPHKNERAEVRITGHISPMNYNIQVKRQGQLVYQTQVSGQTGPYLFSWNGYKNDGQPAQNGDHDVVITGTNSSGQSVTKTVQVVVNFQGK